MVKIISHGHVAPFSNHLQKTVLTSMFRSKFKVDFCSPSNAFSWIFGQLNWVKG